VASVTLPSFEMTYGLERLANVCRTSTTFSIDFNGGGVT
jgi:hypothetical protein